MTVLSVQFLVWNIKKKGFLAIKFSKIVDTLLTAGPVLYFDYWT